MPGTFAAKIMFGPDDGRLLLRQLIPDNDVTRVRQKIEFPVAVDIDKFAGLHISGSINFMLSPRCSRIATRILDPANSPAEVIAGDDIRAPVVVHIQRRI